LQLKIILVGQPELLDKLQLPTLRQLNQRVTVRYHLMPLDRNEMHNYIQHRLKVATSSNNSSYGIHFTDKAIDAIYESSRGTPRMVNILCDRALLAGYISETHMIDEHIVHKCIQEVGRK